VYADTETAQAERLGEGLAHRAGVLRGLIQDPANGLRGIPLPRTPVNSASPRSRRAWQTRRCNPLGASVVNEHKVAGLASPTDVVGNGRQYKRGKRAS
jgi:hypothetical protein